MDVNEFREFGKAAIDFIADYLDTIRDRPVLPSVKPGFLQKLLPTEAPEKPEHWKDVMTDIENIILPGMTHWQSPNFHAYYPAPTSYPSIIGEMLSAGFGTVGFSWVCSPVCTELEVIVMDWLCKFLGLPEYFLNTSDGKGGGVIQGSASEAILIALLAAREKTFRTVKALHPELSESEIRGRLIAYSSDQSNSAVEKAGIIAAIEMRLIKSDENCSLCHKDLREAISNDILAGRFPVICITSFGTTGTCAYDNLEQIGPVCNEFGIWLHVDGAYAGAALCCPEYRPLVNGLNYADSFNYNLHKWMLVNFECCAMWFKDSSTVVDAFAVSRIYLDHKYEKETNKAPDYRHWQIALGRRFRSLKVWIVLRTYGAEKIRAGIRHDITLANLFANYVRNDERFIVVTENSLALVCFRLKAGCDMTERLIERITERNLIYMIKAKFRGKLIIRFVVCGWKPEIQDVEFAWKEIYSQTNELFNKEHNNCKLNNDILVHNKLPIAENSEPYKSIQNTTENIISNEFNEKIITNGHNNNNKIHLTYNETEQFASDFKNENIIIEKLGERFSAELNVEVDTEKKK